MNDLPKQTIEERANRITKAKISEAKEDEWVKNNNIVLERDSCEECLNIRTKDERNYTGDRCFCSAGHAYEVGYFKKQFIFNELRKEIFDTIYQWGRVGVVADENSPAIKEKLDQLEERYY